VLHATNLRIPIVEVEGGSLTALAGFDGHQGVALVVEPRQFASLDDVLARAAERNEPPFILVLDSLEDPHNVGTLLRSAEAAGVHGVLFPTHRQAPLSPSAVKASAGAIEHLLLCPVDDLPGALSDLHTRGVRIAGAEGDAPMTARQSDLRGPLAIVVGSEGQGLGPAVRRRADLFMRIPMKGAVGSLNAAVAGSILLFEALAQRDPNATPRVAPEHGTGREEEPVRPTTTASKGSKPGPKAAPATGSDTPIEASAEADTAAPPETKLRVRKGLTTQPDAPATEATDGDAASPSEAKPKPKPRVRKSASIESDDAPPTAPDHTAAAATTKAKPGRPARKPKTTQAADPSPKAVAESLEEELLPTDGPKKRSSRAR
jgi:23S rRNA (guanosine2251-2'-O)-methyltransferase